MVQASDIDPRFVFEAHDWPNGHYIHTIGGHNEDPVRSYYWILYRLPDSPDLNNLPGNKFMNSVRHQPYIQFYSLSFYDLNKINHSVSGWG